MAVGQRVIPRPRIRREPNEPRTVHRSIEVFLWSRAAIWIAALFALEVFANGHPTAGARWDRAWMHDSGSVFDVWARWDSSWFLEIARWGYTHADHSAAFYPLYPGLVGGLGRVFFGHYVAAGVAISLVCALGAFILLERLAERHLGAEGARRAVLYLALFPMALFLQAVYSESLCLLLCLAAFLLAERDRFLPAALCTGLALLTRPNALAVVPALAILAWQSRDRLRSLASLVVIPLVFAAYPLVLWQQKGSAWEFLHTELRGGGWHRGVSHAGPLGGIWEGLRAGWAGVRQLAAGADGHVYWPAAGDTPPLRAAALNLEQLGFLCLFVWLTVVAWRRFGAAYGVFCAVSLAIPLSLPNEEWPLLSLPRFGLLIFPFFLALAAVGGRPRVHTAIVAVSSILLGVTIVEWVLWHWVA
ncbi:MAG: hypothetical protein QOE36_3603 [Gaiellaceae bacterium]|nr:hypothetical protein [Gaiellaceae bacterium]